MASRQFSGSSGMGTSASPVQDGLWSYAVPSRDEPSQHVDGTSPVDTASSYPNAHRPRPNPSSTINTNGTSRQRVRTKSKSMQGLDIAYAASSEAPRSQNDAVANGDGTYDAPRLKKSTSRATSRERPRVKRKGSLGAVSALSTSSNIMSNGFGTTALSNLATTTTSNNSVSEQDKWIHRDKLQQIEIREMMEQGRMIDLPSRSGSRAGIARSQASAADLEARAQEDGDYYANPEKKRQKTFSPTLSSEQLREEAQYESISSDVATPQPSSPVTSNHRARRPSTSRIPVNTKSSPADDGQVKTWRARSNSQSSQNMLETAATQGGSMDMSRTAATSTQSPAQSSPPKGRTNASTTGAAVRGGRGGARGGRAASGQARPRTATSPGNDITSRPTTSGGPPRTPTARPEGDPPWLENMYKPDPRLPQDQQMLPTHARRLAEQQQQQLQQQMAFDPNRSPRKHPDLVLLDDDDDDQIHQDQYREQEQSFSQHESPTKPPSTRSNNNTTRGDVIGRSNSNSPQKASQANRGSPQKRDGNSHVADGGANANTSPEKRLSGQWPLRTLSFNKYSRDQNKAAAAAAANGGAMTTAGQEGDENAPWASPRSNASPQSEVGTYSLLPTIHQAESTEQQKAMQRSSASNQMPVAADNTVGTTVAQKPIRLPEEPEMSEKDAKKKGCAGCCVVM